MTIFAIATLNIDNIPYDEMTEDEISFIERLDKDYINFSCSSDIGECYLECEDEEEYEEKKEFKYGFWDIFEVDEEYPGLIAILKKYGSSCEPWIGFELVENFDFLEERKTINLQMVNEK